MSDRDMLYKIGDAFPESLDSVERLNQPSRLEVIDFLAADRLMST